MGWPCKCFGSPGLSRQPSQLRQWLPHWAAPTKAQPEGVLGRIDLPAQGNDSRKIRKERKERIKDRKKERNEKMKERESKWRQVSQTWMYELLLFDQKPAKPGRTKP